MKRMNVRFWLRPREKRQRVEHNILASCYSQEVSVAMSPMTASTSLSAGPSSPTLTPASSPHIFSSAVRMRGDIGAYHMSELSHLGRTLRCLIDLGGLLKINQRHVLLQRYDCKCVHLEREASGLHNSWNSCFILRNRSRHDLRRPEIQIFTRCIPVYMPPLCARYARIYSLLETQPTNFCLYTPLYT